jgi:GNAT superfamily N-acetyltransferase
MSSVVDRTTTFRLATPADIGAIVALVESAYRGDVSRKGWTTEADLLDGQRTDPMSVAELLAKPGCSILLGECGAALIGADLIGAALIGSDLVACANIERRGDVGYFGMFSVRPDAQGTGLGRAMLAEAERIARSDWKCTEMHMTVISVRDELIAWYERRGYRRTGIYSPFPYGDERFGIPKRDDLRFELLVKPL